MAILKPSAQGAAVVVCTTCRFSADAREDAEGRRGGAVMLDALRKAADADPACADLTIEPMACLWACSEPCAVHLRTPDKMGYLMGRFAPTDEAARAILDYAAAWRASEEGGVPYKQWPEGVKGHFIARIPPAGQVGVA